MRKEANSQENTSSGMTPKVPWRILTVRSLDNYCLVVQFMDGLSGLVDLSTFVTAENSGVFSVLKNIDLFKKAYIDRGAITWPGDLDLAPDAMYDSILKTGKYVL